MDSGRVFGRLFNIYIDFHPFVAPASSTSLPSTSSVHRTASYRSTTEAFILQNHRMQYFREAHPRNQAF